jgi:hypothetical protein
MEKVTRETTITQGNSPAPVGNVPKEEKASGFQTIEYIIYFISGVIEVLLAARFVLKLTGASVASAFVNFIYKITAVFGWPFFSIFRTSVNEGLESTASVFEPSTLVAIAVYALLAWGIVTLVRVLSRKPQAE